MSIRYSSRAAQDLDEIADYTSSKWGDVQVARYLAELERRLNQLESNPLIGRPCEQLSAGLRRHEIASHVAFYRIEADDILIVRVLHRTSLPTADRLD